ncbi:MAG: phage holin family protein [Bacteroidetes bacterium]|nr:MAG: phage holin family protein [Bacteroidota bacterium]
MDLLSRLIVGVLAVLITAWLLPGVHVDSVLTAILVAIVIAFLNAIVKPVLVILTIPVTILTLGLFLLVINALLIQLSAKIVDGFSVSGFWTALAFSIILSLVSSILHGLNRSPRE